MTARTWTWLRSRIEGLLSRPGTRLWRATRPPEEARSAQ